MKPRRVIATACILIFAAALQAGLSNHIAIHHARPDFVLVAVLCLGALENPETGVVTGFAGGMLSAALSGANYGSYLVSRILAGGLAGEIPPALFRDRWITTLLAAAVGTVLGEVVYFLMAPTTPVTWWLRTMSGEVVYNTVLALPLLPLIDRAIGGERYR